MSKLVRKEDVLESKVFSRDLREYVVPVRCINQAETLEEPDGPVENSDEMLRVLFNRCYALTEGATCLFCGIRQACKEKRSVMKDT